MNKTKGKQDQVERPELLAFASVVRWHSGLMRRSVKPVNGVESTCSVRPNRTLTASLKNAPLIVVACSRAILMPKPKDGVL